MNSLVRRRCFTLVELLIVVAVIGIMAGMILYTLAGAQRDSLVARTQGTIKKLNEIVLARWEEYRYRAAKINLSSDDLARIETGTYAGQVPVSPREGAKARLSVLRDLMRMEMPDQYEDILYPPAIYPIVKFNGAINPPVSRNVPGQYNNLRQRYGLAQVLNPYSGPVIVIGSIASTNAYDSAELLYEIVASSTYNGGNGLEYFRPTEIGDVDSDGHPEFIDAWGTPICFIRWPAGYGQPSRTARATALANGNPLPAMRPADAIFNDTTVRDPLDPLLADPRNTTATPPWMLVPLIVSAGGDREFNLQLNTGVVYATTTTVAPFIVDPYASTSGVQQGELVNANSTADADNLTNYDLLLQ